MGYLGPSHYYSFTSCLSFLSSLSALVSLRRRKKMLPKENTNTQDKANNSGRLIVPSLFISLGLWNSSKEHLFRPIVQTKTTQFMKLFNAVSSKYWGWCAHKFKTQGGCSLFTVQVRIWSIRSQLSIGLVVLTSHILLITENRKR